MRAARAGGARRPLSKNMASNETASEGDPQTRDTAPMRRVAELAALDVGSQPVGQGQGSGGAIRSLPRESRSARRKSPYGQKNPHWAKVANSAATSGNKHTHVGKGKVAQATGGKEMSEEMSGVRTRVNQSLARLRNARAEYEAFKQGQPIYREDGRSPLSPGLAKGMNGMTIAPRRKQRQFPAPSSSSAASLPSIQSHLGCGGARGPIARLEEQEALWKEKNAEMLRSQRKEAMMDDFVNRGPTKPGSASGKRSAPMPQAPLLARPLSSPDRLGRRSTRAGARLAPLASTTSSRE